MQEQELFYVISAINVKLDFVDAMKRLPMVFPPIFLAF